MQLTANPNTGKFQAGITEIRRALGASGILSFAEVYMSHYLKHPASSMHKDVAEILHAASLERGRKIAIAAPRGHAKSTLGSLFFVLWSICYGRETFVLLVSETADQANKLLQAIKEELESNPLLRQDFPEVCEIPGIKPGPMRWREDEIVTRNGVMVTALGASKRMRGRRNAEHRPSLIVLDDVESEQTVNSPDQREKLQNWFFRTVLKAGDNRTNFVVMGTILHHDSLLATLLDPKNSPSWRGKLYRAVATWSPRPELWARWERIFAGQEEHEGNSGEEAARRFFEAHRAEMVEGTEVLWPEKEDYRKLMEIRLTEGVASFDSEKQNNPIDPKSCLFLRENFIFWNDKHGTEADLIASLANRWQLIGACDPSMGKTGRHSDYCAIVTVLRDLATGTNFILDVLMERLKPHEIIEWILTLHTQRKYSCFVFEANHFQEFVATELQRQGDAREIRPNVLQIKHTTDKIGRIQTLEPLIKRGMVQFHRNQRMLLDQLYQFPKGAHDDGPDALEMAVSQPSSYGGTIVVGRKRRWDPVNREWYTPNYNPYPGEDEM